MTRTKSPIQQSLRSSSASRRAGWLGPLFALVLLLWSQRADADRHLTLAYPTLRPELGVAGQISPEGHAHFLLNVQAGAGVWIGHSDSYEAVDNFILLPEVGYTFDTSTLHAFNVGLGLGGGGAIVFGAVTPRFVVGDLNGELAMGVRTGLSAALGLMLNFELSHQFLATPTLQRNDITFTVGFNVGYLLLFLKS